MNPQPNYRRILVTLLSPIGDTLFATTGIRLLRKNYPAAYIAALAFPTNQGILEDNPDLDRIFTYPTLEWWPGWQYFVGLLRELHDLRFDLAVEMCTAFWISRLLIAPRQRVRLHFRPFWWLIPRQLSDQTQRHAVHHYMDVLSQLGLQDSEPCPRITLTAEDLDFADSFLHAWGKLDDAPLIAIHPGGEGFNGKKCWRPDGFAWVGRHLVNNYGARILLLGGDSDRERSQYVAQQIGQNTINGTGTTTLKQTAALVSRCQLFIGNDSSPLHIAGAVGTPVVGIYGPSDPANFHPFGIIHVAVRARRPCAPCFHFVGSVPLWRRTLCRSCKALEEITNDEVLAGAREILAKSHQPAYTTLA